MSKRSRRAAVTADRQGARRLAPPPSRRFSLRWLVVSGAAILVGLVVVGVVVFGGVLRADQRLPASQTGPAPWPPETAGLRARLAAIGLPTLTAEGEAQHAHQHLDVFVDGQAVPVPTDIGVNAAAGFLAPIHTHDATGIIHVESPVVRDFTLGEFFDVWGVRFDGHCVGGCDGSGRTLSVFLNGQPFAGDPRSLVLAAHQEIVVALGTPARLPSPIPAAYAFPAGL